MSWTASRRTQVGRSRGIRSTRARFVLEGLEERTVLTAGAGASGMGAGVAEIAQLHVGHLHHPEIPQLAVLHDGHVHHGFGKAVEVRHDHGPLGAVRAARLHHGRRHGPHGALAKAHSQMTVTGLTINDVGLVSTTSGDQFVANATLSGTIKHHAFSLPLAIPLTVTPGSAPTSTGTGSVTSAAASPTQVLNLSLGPVNLSLLGLNVHLGSSCTIGATNDPITVKLTAIPTGSTSGGYAGGAVGSLLSGVANLLNGGTPLSGLGSQLSSLESGLTQALNGALAGLNSGNSAATGSTMHAPAGQHEVLDLDLNPINLDVLGALVETSSIWLTVTAARGPGNLLGNLLG